jgi:hypothetical protein
MPKKGLINIFGKKFYFRMKPTFSGAKAPVLCAVPSTADSPTGPQRKARAWLGRTALGLTNTFGTVSDTGHGIGGPKIALEIFKKSPGKGAHGGKATLREYAIARRKGEAAVRRLEQEAAVVVPL